MRVWKKGVLTYLNIFVEKTYQFKLRVVARYQPAQ